jgi:hypothetical protein
MYANVPAGLRPREELREVHDLLISCMSIYAVSVVLGLQYMMVVKTVEDAFYDIIGCIGSALSPRSTLWEE